MATAARLRVAFVAAAAAWAILLPLAPFVASRAHATMVASAIVAAVYGIGSLVCHQLPDRSFHLWGAQLPVCARCAGIYAAAALSAPLALRRARGASDVRANRARLLAAVMPSAATLVYEWMTGAAPANWIRFAAGVPLGGAVAWLLVAASRDQVN
jgi:uncharacterized membrane protein